MPDVHLSNLVLVSASPQPGDSVVPSTLEYIVVEQTFANSSMHGDIAGTLSLPVLEHIDSTAVPVDNNNELPAACDDLSPSFSLE
ncbi:hypothetical protein V6N13_000842 [Hibiscus sabdariffa]|uniref:Uncharacterized protein n=1 Tax=Hibiscus sabdariffa TaxID=183260 RepID=A0ABR2G7F6_9ROSI